MRRVFRPNYYSFLFLSKLSHACIPLFEVCHYVCVQEAVVWLPRVGRCDSLEIISGVPGFGLDL